MFNDLRKYSFFFFRKLSASKETLCAVRLTNFVWLSVPKSELLLDVKKK
jgi:hypothetical protein